MVVGATGLESSTARCEGEGVTQSAQGGRMRPVLTASQIEDASQSPSSALGEGLLRRARGLPKASQEVAKRAVRSRGLPVHHPCCFDDYLGAMQHEGGQARCIIQHRPTRCMRKLFAVRRSHAETVRENCGKSAGSIRGQLPRHGADYNV
jgi:hypothetical protein